MTKTFDVTSRTQEAQVKLLHVLPQGRYSSISDLIDVLELMVLVEDSSTHRWIEELEDHYTSGWAQSVNDMNRLDSDGGPALEYIGHEMILQRWFEDGVLHRDGAPAHTFEGWVDDARVKSEKWSRHGVMHRDGGPALTISTFDRQSLTDKPLLEAYFVNGQLHNVEGPTLKGPGLELWARHGYVHRDDGPAIVQRLPDDSLQHRYFVWGSEVSEEDFHS